MFQLIPLDNDSHPLPVAGDHWVKLNQARDVAKTLANGAVIRRTDSDWSITVTPTDPVQQLRELGMI